VIAVTEPLLHMGIRSVLVARPDLELISECRTLSDTARALRKYKPRVLVADGAFCHEGDLDACMQLPHISPTTTIVWLTRPGASVPPELLVAGPSIILPSQVAPAELIECLQAVGAGRAIVPTAVASGASARRSIPRLAVLTRRERQIAQAVASGKRNKEIAEAFAISPATVKLHLHRIYTKLGVSGRLALFRALMDVNEPPFAR
jgi:DNA-binding NarL/FixJ family response regulator